jgi:hypothetical protein
LGFWGLGGVQNANSSILKADDSSVTPQEAVAFLAPPQNYDSQASHKTNKQPQGDDVDDLLDQIE